ncbi:MAG: tRNA (adenosine(37)-N6)-threonylcarbamoyltransferase complex ATPase subunit type 1 TsaE [Candidatus Nanopelagicales bacterium]
MSARETLLLKASVANAQEMIDLGCRLAESLQAGDVVVLVGDLGAGKTTLTRGIGSGLGVRGPVTSPTFVVARHHPSITDDVALVHVDAYRISSVAEIDDLDLENDQAVTVVEWGAGLVEHLSDSHLRITLSTVDEAPEDVERDTVRRVRIDGIGPRWRAVRL